MVQGRKVTQRITNARAAEPPSMPECTIGLGPSLGLIKTSLLSWDYGKRSICHEIGDLPRRRLPDPIGKHEVYHASDSFRPFSIAIS
jgi:hypothetical protein